MNSSDMTPESILQAQTSNQDQTSFPMSEKSVTTAPVVETAPAIVPALVPDQSERIPCESHETTQSKSLVETTSAPPTTASISIFMDSSRTASVPALPIPVPQMSHLPGPVTVSSAPIPAQAIKNKSKKKKIEPVITMATAATAALGGTGAQGENTGRWTAEEHRLFLQGLEQHGKGWKKIASLIKSRTVVQIRTHAQKYFQKLAKARQNGEDGEISMDARGGPTSVTSGGLPGVGFPNNKRRRLMTGTKRKAITSVVVSSTREGNSIAAAQAAAGIPCPVPPLPAVAPALASFVVPIAQAQANVANSTAPSISTSQGSITGAALEDSLFRFLTPAPVHAGNDAVQVNEVARQAGANPITLPPDYPSYQPSCGEVSPTGVSDFAVLPSWPDMKDMPSWYAKGCDIDSLLDVADTLDWLADTGDLHETYDPPPSSCQDAEHSSFNDPVVTNEIPLLTHSIEGNFSSDSLPCGVHDVVPPLPSLFESEPLTKRQKISSNHLSDMDDDDLDVFDTPLEEHAFVSALLENNGESSGSLPVLS